MEKITKKLIISLFFLLFCSIANAGVNEVGSGGTSMFLGKMN